MASGSDWRAIFIAYGIGVAAAVQVGRVAPAADALRHQIALGLATLGWAVSLITCASALLGIAAGYWVARKGPRFALRAGSLALAAAVLASAVAPSAPFLLAARLAEGFGYLAIAVAAPTLISDAASPGDRPAALALWGTFFTLGLSLAAVAGGSLSGLWGWRGWFGANAGLMLAAALAALALPAGPARSDAPAGPAPAARLRLPRAPWLLGAAFLGLTLLQLALLSMLPSFLVEVRHETPAAAGSLTGLVALASIAGSLAYGLMANRLGASTIILAAAALLAASAFPAFGAGPGRLPILFATLAVFAGGILMAFTFAAVPRLVADPARIGPANGLITQLGSLGALTGPPLVGALVSAEGWAALSALIVLFTLSFVALALAANAAAPATA
jgi:MFS family permease